ncbi:MAG: glycine cleavage system protein GcvH [Acidimicrobiia bacterium]|nr:glycine cleavage system protein GcvH [Acidimicrobiia bacterium]NNF70064.1 glycine cleavage system protein GcvH [Acidimicrobiia bacterium]
MQTPDDRKYTDQHEWIRSLDSGDIEVGITDYAQDALGDIVFVDLPTVGASVAKGDTVAEIESTKSVGEVYAPVAGTISAVNGSLDDAPETVNQDPYGAGWIYRLTPSEATDSLELLDAAGYAESVA